MQNNKDTAGNAKGKIKYASFKTNFASYVTNFFAAFVLQPNSSAGSF